MKKTAEETLFFMIKILTAYLQELEHVHDTPHQQFAYGEKTAYVECLEWILQWEDAERYGAPQNVEHNFSI